MAGQVRGKKKDFKTTSTTTTHKNLKIVHVATTLLIRLISKPYLQELTHHKLNFDGISILQANNYAVVTASPGLPL